LGILYTVYSTVHCTVYKGNLSDDPNQS
jgi:hypothetical protein